MALSISSGSIKEMKIDALVMDEKFQSRAALDSSLIVEYGDLIKDGIGRRGDPVTACHYLGEYYVVDGWHWLLAAKNKGQVTIPVNVVHCKSESDVISVAISANAGHGKRRTRDDLYRAADMALSNPKIAELGIQEISRMIGCSRQFLNEYRKKFKKGDEEPAPALAPKSKKADIPAENTASHSEQEASQPEFMAPIPLPEPAKPRKAELPAEVPNLRPKDDYDTTDFFGNRLPPHCLRAFEDACLLTDSARRVEGILSAVTDEAKRYAEPYSVFSSDIALFKAKLQEAASLLKGGKPYCICPSCEGSGNEGKVVCKMCSCGYKRGLGWISEAMFKMLTEQQVEKIKTGQIGRKK